jgi:hypothetical protein
VEEVTLRFPMTNRDKDTVKRGDRKIKTSDTEDATTGPKTAKYRNKVEKLYVDDSPFSTPESQFKTVVWLTNLSQ